MDIEKSVAYPDAHAQKSSLGRLWKLRVTLARDGKGWKTRSVAKG